jgi:hypothetical protein
MKYSVKEVVIYKKETVTIREVHKVGSTYAYVLSSGESCFEDELRKSSKDRYVSHVNNLIRENMDDILKYCFSPV